MTKWLLIPPTDEDHLSVSEACFMLFEALIAAEAHVKKFKNEGIKSACLRVCVV